MTVQQIARQLAPELAARLAALAPLQSAWSRFGDAFDVIPDTTPWDHRYARREGGHRPARAPFTRAVRTCFGLVERHAAGVGGSLRWLHGVYVIARDGWPVYVGRAGGSESVLTRLGKHRIKLTGSDWGRGVTHPLRWRAFATARYAAGGVAPQQDRLAEFSFCVFPLPGATTAELHALEGQVYGATAEMLGGDLALNDPARIDRRPAPGFRVAMP